MKSKMHENWIKFLLGINKITCSYYYSDLNCLLHLCNNCHMEFFKGLHTPSFSPQFRSISWFFFRDWVNHLQQLNIIFFVRFQHINKYDHWKSQMTHEHKISSNIFIYYVWLSLKTTGKRWGRNVASCWQGYSVGRCDISDGGESN